MVRGSSPLGDESLCSSVGRARKQNPVRCELKSFKEPMQHLKTTWMSVVRVHPEAKANVAQLGERLANKVVLTIK